MNQGQCSCEIAIRRGGDLGLYLAVVVGKDSIRVFCGVASIGDGKRRSFR